MTLVQEIQETWKVAYVAVPDRNQTLLYIGKKKINGGN